MIAHVLVCLAALSVTACAALPEQKSISYADAPTPAPQTINLERPSPLPSAPPLTTEDTAIVADNAFAVETVPSCKVGFDMILADAGKKIQARREHTLLSPM